MVIRFTFENGFPIFVNFSSDFICDIIEEDIFQFYLKQGCTWDVVGDDGLTFVERLEKKYERK